MQISATRTFRRFSHLPIGIWLLLCGSEIAFAAAPHSYTIINNSSQTIHITDVYEDCVSSSNYPSVIGPKSQATISWEDVNSGVDCVYQEKWTAFKFTYDNNPD